MLLCRVRPARKFRWRALPYADPIAVKTAATGSCSEMYSAGCQRYRGACSNWNRASALPVPARPALPGSCDNRHSHGLHDWYGALACPSGYKVRFLLDVATMLEPPNGRHDQNRHEKDRDRKTEGIALCRLQCWRGGIGYLLGRPSIMPVRIAHRLGGILPPKADAPYQSCGDRREPG